ncbi:MAG: hypothetical protein Q9185_004270 [Variospora sp. 1 TL-2023]
MSPAAFLTHLKTTAHDLGSRAHGFLLPWFGYDTHSAVIRSLSRTAPVPQQQSRGRRRRRWPIDDASVEELQVYRYPPSGGRRGNDEEEEEEERWVVRNRDAYRSEEWREWSGASREEPLREVARREDEEVRNDDADDTGLVVEEEDDDDETDRRRKITAFRTTAAAVARREHGAEELEGWLGGEEKRRDFGFGDVVVAGGRRNAITGIPRSVGPNGASGRSDNNDNGNGNGNGRAASPPPSLPPLEALNPLPRHRSRPLVRDIQRRSARVWDEEENRIFFAALDHAIGTSMETGISPHLSGQELERRGVPTAAAAAAEPKKSPSAGYEDTDIGEYRDLDGQQQQRGRQLPRAPMPEAVVTIPARVYDADAARNHCAGAAPIRGEMFRPLVAATGSTKANFDEKIGMRVEGYLVDGSVDDDDEKEEKQRWKRPLTVKTAEWVPFPGSWAERWALV